MTEVCWKCEGKGGWYYGDDPNMDVWESLLFSSEWMICFECDGPENLKENEMKIVTYEMNFKTREEYLKWRQEWKADYKDISQKIRELKNARKEFIWEYRPKELTMVKRRKKVGPNPNHSWSAAWKAQEAKYEARAMLEHLKKAKIKAGQQRAERFALEMEMA